jgi:Cof subfamily protein (haloacid dehalogenase superfamily)
LGTPISNLCSNSFKNLEVRLAFFDIDGTLVNAQGEIGAATKTGIEKFRTAGGAIAIASGRPYFSARAICAELKINAPSVFFSGSLIVDPLSGKTLKETPLAKTEVLPILNFARKAGYHIEAYTADSYFVEHMTRYAEIHATYIKQMPNITNLEEIIGTQAIQKLVICTDQPEERSTIEAFLATQSLSVGIGYGAAHPAVSFFNLTSAQASRLAALEFILEKLDIPSSQVAAFGDGESDLPFLTNVGFGVAMGNSPEPVRTQAPFITKSVEDDGVGFALDLLTHNK